MSKINKEITIFIVLATLVVLGGLLIKLPFKFNTSPPSPSLPPTEPTVVSMDLQFKDGISESQVKTILENYSMTKNYSIEYNTNNTDEKYYIIVDKNRIYDIKSELKKEENWTHKQNLGPFVSYIPAIRKGDYYIIAVTEQTTHDKNFFDMLNKYNLQLMKFVWCTVQFENPINRSKSWITEKDAIKIKDNLEMNENIITVIIGYGF
jgi:hypothetical protein